MAKSHKMGQPKAKADSAGLDPKGRYRVVQIDDVRVAKYLRSDEGMEAVQAQMCALPVDGAPAFAIITLEEDDRYKDSAEPVHYRQVLADRTAS